MKEIIRKTKIVCTLGPATDKGDVLKQLMEDGLNVCRLNFSHGTYEDHSKRIAQVKNLREELGLPIALLLDTKGPEIRLKNFNPEKLNVDGEIELKQGQRFILTVDDIEGGGDENHVSITFKDLVKDVKPGVKILLADGLIEMVVEKLTEKDIVCKVLNGGFISDQKGVNVPNVHLSMPYISEKDSNDIVFGVKNDFDFIAASFAQTPEDILEIRKILEEHGGRGILIIAKIENAKGVENIDEIIRVSDGVMVARGDMGVEIPLEDVPAVQKMIIKKVYRSGKPVITATQMLESMMEHPRPTRAEATDVANAIYDGTSAIMLSGETAVGKYPVEALQTMVRIALKTEEDINYVSRFKQAHGIVTSDITDAISHASCTTAVDLNAKAIITVSSSGRTASMISRFRPSCPIIGGCLKKKVCRQLNLTWGVTPLLLERKDDVEELFQYAVDEVEKLGLVSAGDLTVLTSGVPLGVSGTTNLVKVQVAGHILVSGTGVGTKRISSNLCIVHNLEDLKTHFKAGDIIVAAETNHDMMEQLREAGGIITEKDGLNSHAATVGLSLDIPVLVGAKNATQLLKSGSYVHLDSENGVVSIDGV